MDTQRLDRSRQQRILANLVDRQDRTTFLDIKKSKTVFERKNKEGLVSYNHVLNKAHSIRDIGAIDHIPIFLFDIPSGNQAIFGYCKNTRFA